MRTSYTYLKLSALLFLLLQASMLAAQETQHDSLPCMKLSFNNIRMCATDADGNSWLVCGTDSDSIILVTPEHVKVVSQQMHLPESIHFTCLLPVDRHTILLGTASDYIYMLRNRRFVRLDKSYGLNDSSIFSMGIDREKRYLYINTQGSKYVLHNGSTKKDFRFYEIKGNLDDTPKTEKIISRYFRKPLQKAVCDAFSDVDLSFRNQKYLGNKEQEQITRVLEPGDILIKRNDFQVSNLGISGFWTHSAIYLGTLSQLNQFFDGIPMLNGQKASEYIRENYNEVHQQFTQKNPVIIEAIGKGVMINSLEHIAKVDYFAGLRPNLPKEEIFRSILISFTYFNRPYDFLFNFESEDAVVCSELIYKSYSETPDKKGLTFIGNSRDGEFFFYPNDFAVQYCKQQGSGDAAFSLVTFYDGGAIENKEIPCSFCETIERRVVF